MLLDFHYLIGLNFTSDFPLLTPFLSVHVLGFDCDLNLEFLLYFTLATEDLPEKHAM